MWWLRRRTRYPYRIFFKRICPEDDARLVKRGQLYIVTPKDALYFFTPLYEGETVMLPTHLKELWDLPKWFHEQVVWKVETVVHLTGGARHECDQVILVPSLTDPLQEACELNFKNQEIT